MKTEEKNKILFEEKPVPNALFTLALPTIVGQLIILIYNMADTFYIGRTNNPLMVAGAALILPVFNITISIASIAGVGGGSLISRLLGVYRRDEAKKVSSFCFLFTLIVAAVFSAGAAAFMNPLLKILGASGGTFEFARQYALCVIVIGGVPTVLSMTMSNLLRSVGCASKAGFGVSMGGILNILLDPLFMFVILPDGKEILGAGIATMLSNVIVCCYFFVVLFRMRKESVLTFSPKTGLPGKKEIGEIFSVGIPSAISTLLFDLDYVIIDKLATGYGDVALAAVGIVLKAERLPLNIGVGLCQGMTPLAAYNYSAGNYPRMKKTISFSRLAGIAIAIFSIIIYEVFAGTIMNVFINDAETVAIGTNFLRIRALATPFMFLCFHVVHSFQSMGKGNKSLFLAVLRWAVFNIPMLFLLEKLFGMYGIVWAQITADFFVALISLITYGKFRKKYLSGVEKND